ncbi:MAG: efflux RND transporter periplasmic adaptor subunit, partial [Deltaproteobacteria bacterium]
GMTAQVSFSVGDTYTARLIPKDALVIRGDRNFVYIVNGDTVREEEVTLGNSVKGMVEIKGNVKTGERIVIRGNERLRPGQQVEILGNKKGQR